MDPFETAVDSVVSEDQKRAQPTADPYDAAVDQVLAPTGASPQAVGMDLGVTEPVPQGPVTAPLQFVRAPGQPPPDASALELGRAAARQATLAAVDQESEPWPSEPLQSTPAREAARAATVSAVAQEERASQDRDSFAGYMRFLAENQTLTPDAAGEAVRISLATGRPIDWVSEHLDQARREYRPDQVDWAGMIRDHPMLVPFIGDPTHAALVMDDAANLTGLAKWVTGDFHGAPSDSRWPWGAPPWWRLYRPPVPLAELRDAILQQEQAFRQTAQNWPDPADMLRRWASRLPPDRAQELTQIYAAAQQFGPTGVLLDAHQAVASYGRSEPNAKELEELKRQGVGRKAYGAAADSLTGKILLAPFRLAPAVVGDVAVTAAGTAAAGPVGGFLAGSGYWWLQGYGPMAEQLQEVAGPDGKKLSPEDAQARAWIVSSMTAPLLQGGLGTLFRGAAAPLRQTAQETVAQSLAQSSVRQLLGRFALGWGKDVVLGAGTMAAQGALEASALEGAKDDVAAVRRSDSERMLAVAKAAGERFAQALPDMLLIGAMHPGRTLLADLGQRRAAIASATRIQGLTDTALPTKLLERVPEEAEQLLARLAQSGKDPVTTVYADREAWDRYWQGQQQDPREVAGHVVGDGGKAYDEAARTKDTLAIPVEKFLTRLAKEKNGEHARALAPDLKVAADVNTPSQESAELAWREARMRELAKVAPDAMEEGQRRVFEDYRGRALAAGEDPKVADANARLFSAGLATLAERAGRSGETAWELWQAHPLNIFGPQGQGLPPLETRLSPTQELIQAYGKMPLEKQREVYYRDPTTGLPNERALQDLPPDPARPLTAHFKVEGIAYANDKLGGHHVGDEVYRAAARALASPLGFMAKVGGDFAGRVSTPAEAKGIADRANLAMEKAGFGGFRISSWTGFSLKEAAQGHTTEAKWLEAAGQRSKRGERPAAVPEGFKAPAVGRTNAALPESLGPRFEASSAEQRGTRVYREESTGLLTGEGWAARPRRAYEVTFDMNGLGFRNAELGNAFGDESLRKIGEVMAELGGVEFDAAHVHGDEFKAQADDPGTLRKFAEAVQAQAESAKVEMYDPNTHEVVTAHGTGVAHGIGQGEAAAEAALGQHKEQLVVAGLRDPKGESAVERGRIKRRPATAEEAAQALGDVSGQDEGLVAGDLTGGVAEAGAAGGGDQGRARRDLIPLADLDRAAQVSLRRTKLEQPAYHGTPHQFDRFTLDHIGAGEGAQAYGWGLYFAGKKAVGEYYRRELAPMRLSFRGKDSAGSDVLSGLQRDLESISGPARGKNTVDVLLLYLKNKVQDWKRDLPSYRGRDREVVAGWVRAGEKILANPKELRIDEGQLYRVDIPEDSKLLDYDKPFRKQPAPVQAALRRLGVEGQFDVRALGDGEFDDGNGHRVTVRLFYSRAEAEAFARDQQRAGLETEISGPHDSSGKDLYGHLSAKLGGDERASRALRREGIPGLRYFDEQSRSAGRGSHNYVIWDEGVIRSLQALHQGGFADENRGVIEFRPPGAGEPVRFDVRLLDGDASTLLHETMHAFSVILGQVASRSDAPEALKADYDILLKAMGETSHQERLAHHQERAELAAIAEPTAEQAARLKELQAREEKVSHLWEQYLMEGKAPSAELRGTFARFRRWLTSIYRGLAGVSAQYRAKYGEDLQLSDQVRGLFDRLLTAQDKVREARAKIEPSPLADLLGMTPEARGRLAELEAQDREAAETDLVHRLALATHAERQEWYRAEEARIRAQVEAEVLQADPALRAAKALKDGQIGPGLPVKLDRTEVVRRWGKWAADSLPRNVWAKKGDGAVARIDQVADLLGYPEPEDLLKALREAPSLHDVVAARTRAMLEALYPEILQGSPDLQEEAVSSAHTEQHAQALLLVMHEMERRLGGAGGGGEGGGGGTGGPQGPEGPGGGGRRSRVDPAVLRATAERIIGEKTIQELRPDRYYQAEISAARRALEAAKAGKLDVALDEQEAQLLNHFLYRAARDMRGRMDSALERLQGTAKEPWRAALGKADPAIRTTHDAILSAIGLGRPLTDPGAQVQVLDTLVQLAERNATEVPFDSDSLRALLATPRPWRELPVADAQNVVAAVKSLRHWANEWAAIDLEGKRLGKEEFVAQAAAEAAHSLPAMPPLPRDPATRSLATRARLRMQGLDAALLETETMARWLSGGRDGLFHKLIVDGYLGCRNRKAELGKAVLEPFLARWNELFRDNAARMRERVDVSDILPLPEELSGTYADTPVTRASLLMMALNMGNADNKTHMLRGYRWSEENVVRLLTDPVRGLSSAEWTWVQHVWDSFENLWPEISKLQEAETGIRPEKVKATPVRLADGTELRGGYFPIKDTSEAPSERPVAGRPDAIAGLFDPDYQRAATSHGFTKSRTHTSVGFTDLSPSVIVNHLAQVLHDLSYRQWVKQTAGVLMDPAMRRVIQQRLGTERELQFLPWLQEIANGQIDRAQRHLLSVEGAARALRSIAVHQAIGHSLSVSAGDMTNPLLAVFAGLVKPQYLAGATKDVIAHWSETRDFVHANSAEVRFREQRLVRDLRDQVDKLTAGKTSRMMRAYMNSSFYLMELTDRLTSRPTWLAKYRQSLAEHGEAGLDPIEVHARAVRDADGVIRQLFPSHDIGGKPAFLRDRRGLGGYLLFLGFANKMHNLRRDFANDLRNSFHDPESGVGSRVGAVGKFAAQMLGIALTQGVLSEYLSGRGQEEYKGETWWEWFFRKLAGGFAYGVPFADTFVEQGISHLQRGESSQVSIRNAPMLSMIQGLMQELGNLAGETRQVIAGEEEPAAAAGKIIETLLTSVFVPRQFQRTGGYVGQLVQGSAQPTGPADLAGGLIYGQRPTGQPNNPLSGGH